MTKLEIINFKNEYSKLFYDLNIEWLNEFFLVEDFDKKISTRNLTNRRIKVGNSMIDSTGITNANGVDVNANIEMQQELDRPIAANS